MKNNDIAKIELTTLNKLMSELITIPDMEAGIEQIVGLLRNDTVIPPEVIGAVAYDYKAIYVYVILPENHTLSGEIMNVGCFIRWDDIAKKLVIYGMLYLPRMNTVFPMERLMGKRVSPGIEIKSIPWSDYKARLLTIQRKFNEAVKLPINEDECFAWLTKAFHNQKRSDVICRMVESETIKTVLGLYFAIAKYYSRRSKTPHMQWWNPAVAEILVFKPDNEINKARAWLSVASASL